MVGDPWGRAPLGLLVHNSPRSSTLDPSKKGTLHHRRLALSQIPNKKVVKKVFDDLSQRFSERPGGYTRITKLGPRQGDGAQMAVIELVE